LEPLVGIRSKLLVGAATVALAASGALGAASPSGIYLSTWGTAHVTFGDAFRAWLTQTGASVAADAPMTLDADRGGFTMPASATSGDRLDLQGRMVYPGDLTVAFTTGAPARRAVLRLGPFYLKVMPEPTWTAGLSVDAKSSAGELRLAAGDTAEVLAAGGSPSPTGFRPASVPFHLTREAAELLARETGRPGPVADSLFGTLVPQFDHVPTGG
jgi:hypothetical protein